MSVSSNDITVSTANNDFIWQGFALLFHRASEKRARVGFSDDRRELKVKGEFDHLELSPSFLEIRQNFPNKSCLVQTEL